MIMKGTPTEQLWERNWKWIWLWKKENFIKQKNKLLCSCRRENVQKINEWSCKCRYNSVYGLWNWHACKFSEKRRANCAYINHWNRKAWYTRRQSQSNNNYCGHYNCDFTLGSGGIKNSFWQKSIGLGEVCIRKDKEKTKKKSDATRRKEKEE